MHARDPDDPVTRATYDTFKAGIVVVFSAGNSGREGQCTITGDYKKAPWVIAVAAGDSERKRASFSSRGTPGGGQATIDGKTWTWQDRPTVTAPGVLVVSTRAISPIGVIGTDDDVLGGIAPQHLPYYTTLSGTSMAAPHVAGIVALLLDADPTLTPLNIKAILQATATSIPYETWEVGAGYVDAFAAVTRAFR